MRSLFVTLPYDDGTVTIRLDRIDMLMIRPSKYQSDDCGLQIFLSNGASWPTINYKSRERAEEVLRDLQLEIESLQQGGAQDV
jgi:hypothetical protein